MASRNYVLLGIRILRAHVNLNSRWDIVLGSQTAVGLKIQNEYYVDNICVNVTPYPWNPLIHG